MITVKSVLNTGNFAVSAKGIFSDSVLEEVLREGLKYIVQRDVATKVYTEVAGVPGKRGGKVLPTEFKRESVAFSEGVASQFKTVAERVLGEKGVFEVEVTEYTGSEDSSPKKGAERYVSTLMATPETEAGMRSMFGILGMPNAKDADTDELVEFAHSKGLAIRAERK